MAVLGGTIFKNLKKPYLELEMGGSIGREDCTYFVWTLPSTNSRSDEVHHLLVTQHIPDT